MESGCGGELSLQKSWFDYLEERKAWKGLDIINIHMLCIVLALVIVGHSDQHIVTYIKESIIIKL